MNPARSRRHARILIALSAWLALGAAGCVSSSIGSDVQRAQELSRSERLARVADREVDPVADADARRLLERPLDADAAVRVALLDNRELRATLREMGIARGRLLQASLLPNPIAEAELLPERNSEIELRVEYDITSALLTPMRANAERPDLEAARHRAAGAVVELGYRVRVAFYALQAAQQRLALAQRSLDAHAAGRDAARAMLEAGNVRELDVASQETAYQRARIAVAELELAAASERERMQRLLGAYGQSAAWQIAGDLAAAPEQSPLPDDLETRAVEASLDLAETRERLEGLARRAGFARTAGAIPDIALDVHALHGAPEEGADSGDDLRFGAGISMAIPLFDRRQGTASGLEAEFDALLERYHGMAIDLRSAAREARNRLRSAHERARQYQDVIVPAQARVVEQTLLQYNAMQVGIFELLSARREQLDIELAHVDVLREYWSAVAEVDALVAGKRVSGEQASESRSPMNAGGAPQEGH